jgi:hypothetical protein
MSSDYKYDIQLKAEEMAEEQFDVDFYKLSPFLRDRVYRIATQEYWDNKADSSRREE